MTLWSPPIFVTRATTDLSRMRVMAFSVHFISPPTI